MTKYDIVKISTPVNVNELKLRLYTCKSSINALNIEDQAILISHSLSENYSLTIHELEKNISYI